MTLKKRFLALAKKHQIAVVVLLLETFGSAATTLLAIVGVALDYSRRPEIVKTHIPDYLFLILIFIATTLVNFFITRQLVMCKRWARSAAVFVQAIQIAIAWNSFSGDLQGKVVGVWLIASAAVGLYTLLSNDVINATIEKIDRD